MSDFSDRLVLKSRFCRNACHLIMGIVYSYLMSVGIVLFHNGCSQKKFIYFLAEEVLYIH